ncbi:MAG: AI-2E family transporter [Gammaproteobacteria bacterium]|nr:AI-2E family transporter [Gammaproteobacteria bacterium]
MGTVSESPVTGQSLQDAEPSQAFGTAADLRTRREKYTALAVQGLFIIALFAVLAEGREVFLPLAMAFLLNFVLRPVVRRLEKLSIPAPVSAALLVVVLGASLVSAVYVLKDPAAEWLQEAPYSFKQLQYRIDEWRKPIADMQAATKALDELRDGDSAEVSEVVVREQGFDEQVVTQTTELLLAVFTTLVVLFFILGWGQRFFRNAVSALPQFRDRRDAVMLVREIEHSITAYLSTITVINLALGVVVALAMFALQMPNPLLWGVVAGLLNYIPYLGPAITTLILAFAAALSFPTLGEAALVPAAFIVITVTEAYFITPFAVGNRLTLNPLLIMLALIIWFWLWGVMGALLTVPILVCIREVLAHSRGPASSLARLFD